MTDPPLPDWPAAMGIDRAAQYVDLSKGTIETLLRQHRFPAPIRLSEGRRGWRRADLDEWVRRGGIDGWAPGRATVEVSGWEGR